MIDRTEFIIQCQAVLDSNADQYAKAYARSGIYGCSTQEEMRVQALYIVNNLKYWRQPNARSVRDYFKAAGSSK